MRPVFAFIKNGASTSPVRLCLLLLVLALLPACARQGGTGRVPADPTVAQATWHRFVTTAARQENQAGPFRLNATLYYSGKEDSQRVTVYFWGNGDAKSPLPLRLDILMGPGSVMAAAREDSRGLFIHVPREEVVYHAEDSGLLAFDLPVPFSLADLSFLVTGRFAPLFAAQYNDQRIPDAEQEDGGDIVYTIKHARLTGFLTLGPDGLPSAWTDGSANGWTLTIEYWPDSTRTTPRKLHIKNAEGREATLIVRELAHPENFAPKQLELAVPPGTRLAPLAPLAPVDVRQ